MRGRREDEMNDRRFKMTLIIEVKGKSDTVNEYWLEDLVRDVINLQNTLIVARMDTEEIYD